MIYYEREVKKAIDKGALPEKVLKLFHNAFISRE
jgi:hypothetical protein